MSTYDLDMPNQLCTLSKAKPQARKEPETQADQTRLAQSVRLAAIGELASGVAHLINNPLTTIIADAQIILQMLPPDHPARESAEAIEEAGWRAQRVVQLLLEFSQPIPQPAGARLNQQHSSARTYSGRRKHSIQ